MERFTAPRCGGRKRNCQKSSKNTMTVAICAKNVANVRVTSVRARGPQPSNGGYGHQSAQLQWLARMVAPNRDLKRCQRTKSTDQGLRLRRHLPSTRRSRKYFQTCCGDRFPVMQRPSTRSGSSRADTLCPIHIAMTWVVHLQLPRLQCVAILLRRVVASSQWTVPLQ